MRHFPREFAGCAISTLRTGRIRATRLPPMLPSARRRNIACGVWGALGRWRGRSTLRPLWRSPGAWSRRDITHCRLRRSQRLRCWHLILVVLSRGLFRIDARRTHAQANLGRVFALPCCALMVRLLLELDMVSWVPAIIAAVIGGIALRSD